MKIAVTSALLLSASSKSWSLVLRHELHPPISKCSGDIASTFLHRNKRLNDRSLSLLTLSLSYPTTNTVGLNMSSRDTGTKFESPSAERNRDPIWRVLEEKVVPMLMQVQQEQQSPPKILEIAAGAGVHTHYFVKQLYKKYQSDRTVPSPLSSSPPFVWYPTDTDPQCLSSIRAYITDDPELLAANVVWVPTTTVTMRDHPPETMDGDIWRILDTATDSDEGHPPTFNLMLNINMIHIAPWSATIGLMKLACRWLRPTGILFLYGPYKVNGTYCESNRYVCFWFLARAFHGFYRFVGVLTGCYFVVFPLSFS